MHDEYVDGHWMPAKPPQLGLSRHPQVLASQCWPRRQAMVSTHVGFSTHEPGTSGKRLRSHSNPSGTSAGAP